MRPSTPNETSWASIYREYSPHFASEILITFIAIALLERVIDRRDRRNQIRRAAAGALRFYVHFAYNRNFEFLDGDAHLLDDDIEAFNRRKEGWMDLMSRTERTKFEEAAKAANDFVDAVRANINLPENVRYTIDERDKLIAQMNILRPLYQETRELLWQSSHPDEIT